MRTREDWLRFSNPLGIIRLVLLVDWDPTGVFGYPRAMDEYETSVTLYLRDVETKQMGVRGNPSLAAVVGKLFAAYSASHRVRGEQDEA